MLEYDSLDNITARYIYGAGIDQPILMEKNGNQYYYHSDHQGSIIAISDGTTGAVVEQYAYSPYGESNDNNTIGNPYRYTGRRLDDETGLYYYRARMYSTNIGRFLQPDPIGYGSGLNLYAYVGGDPLNFNDPSGLFRDSISSSFNSLLSSSSFGRGLQGTIDSQPSISNFLGDHIRERGTIVLDQVAPKIPGTDIRFAFGLGIGKGFSPKVNLNRNNAISNFGLYEIKINSVLNKVGKTDLNRVTQSSGLPTRLHQQVRQLRKKHGKENVQGQVVDNLGQTTTKAAKAAENTRIKDIVNQTGVVPPGNINSFRP